MTSLHNFQRGGILLALICTCAYLGDSFPDSPLMVYDKCIEELNIPPVTERIPILKTVFAIVQSRNSIEKVVACVDAKKETLKSSSVGVESFTGYTFDAQRAEQALEEAYGLYQTVGQQASFCLRFSLADSLQYCLGRVGRRFGSRSSIGDTLEDICSVEFYECMKLEPHESLDCSEEDIQFAGAIRKLFYGKCMSRWEELAAAPTPAECGKEIFPGLDLAWVLPPSEYTQYTIAYELDNVTAAAETHKRAISDFCSRLDEYVSCVQLGFQITKSSRLGMESVIDVDRLPEVLNEYCSQANLISSQYQCTFESVKTHSQCNGGLVDLMSFLDMARSDKRYRYSEFCRRIHKAQKCRVQTQLEPCNSDFASTMAKFYLGLGSGYCDGVFPQRADVGDFLRCTEKYIEHLSDEFDGPGRRGDDPNVVLSYASSYICSVRNEFMECVGRVQTYSEHPIDKFILQLLTPANMKTAFDYTCTRIDELAGSAFCAMSDAFETNRACIEGTAEDLAVLFLEALQMSLLSFDTAVTMDERLCSLLQDTLECFIPSLEKCNASLAPWFVTLTEYINIACGNPTAVNSIL